ncbi:MAG: MerR family transcriptional regulator [Kiloniellales bacterium]|nr:MerR family transcriptional regulator [Kiloniellales bacterium]
MPAINPGGKSAAAFRTISEVSGELEVPQHVLRFWETKFSQVRPLKRGGGRRYYRPEDIVLLRRIRDLLYRDGYTIKGVQRLLRDGLGKPTAKGEGEASDAERRTAMAAAAAGEARANGHSAGAGLSGEAREELSNILDELLEARASLKKARGD